MRLIDIYFRAFKDYRKHTLNNADAIRSRRVVKAANSKKDSLTVTKYTVDINEDWIKAIEEGLAFIEKAVYEERQFIRTEGEVVPIEKVRKTSKDSVEHLSRNSNLITRVPKKGSTLIPDKLYIVEKLSDFAVYENRFLYLLLTYLKDFIYIRLEKIRNKVTSYHADVNITKNIKIQNRDIKFFLEFEDDYTNDPFMIDAYYKIPYVDRLEIIYYSVESLLKSNLMTEVSKAAMIKPPIVKTNVLRMNPNFRAALTLYDFITSYNSDGYTFIEDLNTINPFHDVLNDEIADAIELSTFILYQHGNGIIENLNVAYKEEELRLEQEQKELRISEIARLKRRVKEMKLDLEEYILLLEKQNLELEKENLEINTLKQIISGKDIEIVDLKESNKILEKKVERLEETIIKLQNEMVDLVNKHNEFVEELINQHNQEINELKIKHSDEILELTNKYENQLTDLKNDHEHELLVINEKHNDRVTNLKEEHSRIIKDNLERFNNEKESIRTRYESIITSNEELATNLNETILTEQLRHKAEEDLYNENLKEAYINETVALGKLYSFKKSQGLVTNEDNHTSEENFRRLEAIKKSFNEFFNDQWKLTKAQIRADVREASRKMMLENKKEV